MNLQKNIRARRLRLGLTQAQLAEAIGITRVRVNRIERGEHPPSIARLEQIAKALKSTAADLMR